MAKKALKTADKEENVIAGINEDLKSEMDAIMAMEDERGDISDAIRKRVANIKDKWGFPCVTTRVILRKNRMDKEARAQMEASEISMNKALGYQNELTLEPDVRAPHVTAQVKDIRDVATNHAASTH